MTMKIIGGIIVAYVVLFFVVWGASELYLTLHVVTATGRAFYKSLRWWLPLAHIIAFCVWWFIPYKWLR